MIAQSRPGPAEEGKWAGLRLWIYIRQWGRSCRGGEVGGAEAMDLHKAMGQVLRKRGSGRG